MFVGESQVTNGETRKNT